MSEPDDEEVVFEEAIPRPKLAPEALFGPIGDLVRLIDPQTEADPAALLFTALVGMGNLIGPGPYVDVGAVRHEVRFFSCIVGATAKARKGQSFHEIIEPLRVVDGVTVDAARVSGLSSGEALIARLRDREDGSPTEKRAFIFESEFARLLAVAGREGSTLSAILRDAWDGGMLRALTRKDPLEAKGAFVSIVAHITSEELAKMLDRTEVANGFANRFLFVHAERLKRLSRGRTTDLGTEVRFLGRQLRIALDHARRTGYVDRSASFDTAWDWLYDRFGDEPGLAGAITARAEAQTLRLALLYALVDCAPVLEPRHLVAAYATWKYAEDSARFIFGRQYSEPLLRRLLEEVRSVYPLGLDRTEQFGLFKNNESAARLDAARTHLLGAGLVDERKSSNGDILGRPTLTLYARPLDRQRQPRRSVLGDLIDLAADLTKAPAINLKVTNPRIKELTTDELNEINEVNEVSTATDGFNSLNRGFVLSEVGAEASSDVAPAPEPRDPAEAAWDDYFGGT